MILVTGGAGFIGSNFILDWLKNEDEPVLNLDKLTYAGNVKNLKSIESDKRYQFICDDIKNQTLVSQLLATNCPRAIVHFAAESHVDRSIESPELFVETNVVGTCSLLEACRGYWASLNGVEQRNFRFVHVSTDEVFGSLESTEPAFNESTSYKPNSPYSASKAASDHFVRAYYRTYSLPTITTNCSNNYGPYQFPEKLIPLTILNALAGKPLPVYGDGKNIRDWLFVDDHCQALRCVLAHGLPGETYNIGGGSPRHNIEVVEMICQILEDILPKANGSMYKNQITFVKDRPGHDCRYAIDTTKIANDLGWHPKERLETGLRKTVQWYLQNQEWIESIRSGEYLE